MGDTRFSPGEWKTVNATGQDLKQQIFPMPTREPSQVLMHLLEYLVNAGKELASVADIFVGKMPGQNTPATTTQTAVEQGMKVFTAVYKRVYRSLTKEFRKLYRLNALYLNPQTEVEFLNEPVQQQDFVYPENHIIPAADPSSVSKQEKQAKVQALAQILQLGTINPMAYTQYYLEAFEIPQPERFLMQPQQGPSPEQQQAELQMKLEQQKAQFEMQKMGMQMNMERESDQMKQQSDMQQMHMDQVKGQFKMESDLRMMDHKEQMAKKGAENAGNKGGVRSVDSKPSNSGGV